MEVHFGGFTTLFQVVELRFCFGVGDFAIIRKPEYLAMSCLRARLLCHHMTQSHVLIIQAPWYFGFGVHTVLQ